MMAEQAQVRGAGRIGRGGFLLAAILAAAACASEARQPWPVYEAPAERRLDPSLQLGSQLDPGPSVPRAGDYPAPRGARLWLSGESSPRASARLSALAEARAGARELIASLEADVDGEGSPELVTLSRDVDDTHVLEVYAPSADRVLSTRRLAPIRHLGGRCHLEVQLLGVLRSAEGARPLLWRDRGVGCGRFEGGGYERHLLVEIPSRDALVEIPLAKMRHLEEGASDGYDGAVWRGEAAGAETLYFRGIFWARRACAHPDSGFWLEELAFRRLEADGSIAAYREGRALPLPGQTLPPELLRSHLAPCR